MVDNVTDFKVIGAGLQRTGTFSTRLALTKLMNNRCYHGFTGSTDAENGRFWIRAADGLVTDEEWKTYLLGNGYGAGVGEPISLFYEDLMRVFPDAKVLLTIRPAEDWYRSMMQAIIEPRSFVEVPPISWIFDLWGFVEAKQLMTDMREKVMKRRHLNYSSWSAVEAGKDVAIKFYDDWNKQVVKTVPPERLVIYEVRQGWQPLCEMLGLPVPDDPFPLINDSRTVQWVFKGSYYILVLGLPLLFMTFVYLRSKRLRDLVSPFLRIIISVISLPFLACYARLKRRSSGYTLLKK